MRESESLFHPSPLNLAPRNLALAGRLRRWPLSAVLPHPERPLRDAEKR